MLGTGICCGKGDRIIMKTTTTQKKKIIQQTEEKVHFVSLNKF